METITVGRHVFEIIDHVPLGYEIWNIGKNMPEGYLPLCRLKNPQPYEGCREVEADTLKAIRVEDAQTILAAVGGGQNTVEAMEAYIKRYAKAKPNTYSYRQVQRMKNALPIMKQIKWR